MCAPTYFGVEYEINPWMSNQINRVNKQKAIVQWNNLYDIVKQFARVDLLYGVPNLPDLVFTANAGFVQKDSVILSKFAKPQRQPETEYFNNYFEENYYSIYRTTYDYEGEGDHLVDSKGRHWVGSGFRTDKNVQQELNSILKLEVNVVELVDPRWYHLDTCFCPLPNGELLWYPKAFTLESQEKIDKAFKVKIPISEQDALAFACNSVCLGNNVILPKNSQVSTELNGLGYRTFDVDLSEFLKSGGAAKCLVLYV